MMEVALVLGFLLLVVTLVGHGIWLFVAFVVRGFVEPSQTPRPVAPSAAPKRTCPHCGAACAATFKNCPTCGKLVAELPRSPAAKLESLQRQLDLLLAEEVLSLEQFESARAILRQATDKFPPPSAVTSSMDGDSQLPMLERADVTESVAAPGVGQRLELPAVAQSMEPPPPKRSTWTDWLQAFLEDKNIRWGELLAGMLIVGSSVGLVISLWSTLKNAIPYFPALCFLAVTAAIHGAGLYTLRHWRLKTTSRGLLTISLLLVPLNFLAAIALSEQRSATDPLYLTAVVIGVVAYGWITWSGSRELMHFGASWLALAVLGSAVGQLVIGRVASAGLSTVELHGLFAGPLLTYVVAILGAAQFAARQRLTPRRIECLYRLLGIAFFSLCVALGLLLWKSQAVLDTLSRLAPCVSLAAAMMVGLAGQLLPRVGTSVLSLPWREGRGGGVGSLNVPLQNATDREPDAPIALEQPHRTPLGSLTLALSQGERGPLRWDIAATAVTLMGAMLMVAAVVLAWPDPERLIAVGLVNFVALSWFGFATGLAPLHVPALLCLALAGLIAFHRFGETIGGAGIVAGRTLFQTILLGRSGVVLSMTSLLTTTCALVLWRNGSSEASPSGRREHLLSYLTAAAGMAVLSLGIAGYAGFWPHVVQPNVDRSLATVVFLLFGIAGMIANERLNRIEVAWAGAVVWLAVFLHAFGWNTHLREWLDLAGWLPDRPIVVALLSFATWSLGSAVVGRLRNRFVAPWSAASGRAVVVALFALPWKLWGDFGPHAIYLGWIAALCLGQAHLWQSRNLFSLGQAIAFIAASLGIVSFAERQDWWIAHANEVAAFWDVRHGHWQLAGLALACVPWVLWRRFGRRWAVLARCSDWKLDRALLPAVVIAAALTMWFSIWPFLGFERYQHPELWPVVRQGWTARGWDRVLLWLIGWGAVTWSLEEICRRWTLRSQPVASATSPPIRFPWVAALGTLVVGIVLFVIPQLLWIDVPLARRPPAVDPRVLFGESMWWVAGAGLLASGLSFLERGRWQVRVLTAAAWVALWQIEWLELTATVADRRTWTGPYPLWFGWLDDAVFNSLTLIGIGLALVGGLTDWIVRRFAAAAWQRRQISIRDDVWGVVGWLCLLPVIGLAPQVAIGGAIPDATFVILCWSLLLAWRAWAVRSAAVAFGASHAWCWVFAVTALMSPVEDLIRNYLPDAGSVFVRFLLWSAVALGAFSWLWVYWRDRWKPLRPAWWDWRGDAATITPWLWQQHWSWACLLLSSVIAAWALLRHPALWAGPWAPFGEPVAHVAFAFVAGSTFLAARRWRHRWHTVGLATFAWVPVCAAGWKATEFTAWLGGAWRAFHVWEAGWLTLAVVWLAGRCVAAMRKSHGLESLTSALSRREREKFAALSLWSDVTTVGVLVLAAREFAAHQSVVWPASCVAVVAACAAALAWVNRSQSRVAASIACVVLATAMAWTEGWDGFRPRTTQQVINWWQACLTALGLSAGAWQFAEVWWQRRHASRFDERTKTVTAHVAAGVAIDVAIIFLLIGIWEQSSALTGQLPHVQGLNWSLSDVGGWGMLVSATLPMVVSCWDRYAKGHIPVSGLCGCVWLLLLLVLASLKLPFGQRWYVWTSALLATEILVMGLAWRGLGLWLDRLPAELRTRQDHWQTRHDFAERSLPGFQLVWVVLACVLNVLSVLAFTPLSLRLWSVVSGALLVLGAVAWSRNRRRAEFQQLALGLAAISLLEFLWAWMEPQSRADFWLQRAIRALEALALTAFVFGVWLPRMLHPSNDWRSAVQRAARDVGITAIGTLMVVLVLEARWFDPINGAPVTGLQIALVAAALVGLAVAFLVMALSPITLSPGERVADRPGEGFEASESSRPSEHRSENDLSPELKDTSIAALSLTPALSQREREAGAFAFFTPQWLVYAAEVVVALLFLHCYLTMPELFRGYLQPYWPLIVMAIAFGGVGASELCQREKLSVLAEPFQNSAALLPLIPALGFWVATSRTDYSTVLFAAGLVYVWLNLRRRSFWYVLAASLAGNFGLWSLWSEHGVELLVRPQVWLIPPAVSVLAAAQWNRRRLTDAQLAAIRYPAITLIYVSSAGEMFLTGIAESFWLPIVLMVLSVAGVLAGIWLRVRAFLYLGVSFLLLSLVSMVWHAAEAIDHTWPWWAFGIGLGLGVLTLFGLFERKRNEMLRLLGELRTWER